MTNHQVTVILGESSSTKWMKATYTVVWEYSSDGNHGRFLKFTNNETGKELPKKLQCTHSYSQAAKDAIKGALLK